MGGPAHARRALRHPSFLQLRLCVSANAFVREFPHANCRPVERRSSERRIRTCPQNAALRLRVSSASASAAALPETHRSTRPAALKAWHIESRGYKNRCDHDEAQRVRVKVFDANVDDGGSDRATGGGMSEGRPRPERAWPMNVGRQRCRVPRSEVARPGSSGGQPTGAAGGGGVSTFSVDELDSATEDNDLYNALSAATSAWPANARWPVVRRETSR